MESDIPTLPPLADADIYGSPPYWHKDGDIILTAQDNQGKEHRLRVHRLILCLHSPVFRDMSTLGMQTVNAEETPIVPLKGDDVEDIRALILVLYKGFELYGNPESLTFSGALGVLRLTHKYQMEQLRLAVVNLLQPNWPLNYEEYKRAFISLSDTEKKERLCRSVKLINVARLTDCHSLLLPAFFEVAKSDSKGWRDIINGTEVPISEDWHRIMIGKTAWLGRIKTLEVAGMFVNPQAFLWDNDLPAGQQLSVFKTRSTFLGYYKQKVCKEDARYCVAVFAALKALVGRAVLDGMSIPDACAMWHSQTFKSESACDVCTDWMVSLIRNKEEEIWENIPDDFDLPKVDPKEYKKKYVQKALV
ncbi:hypothetical protein M422DRAFT_256773 [Sphaerobolus stellatus SS14]|uniref:Unplaced genomic scaffold SPHSTscaffold_70, whole genome shotgun sequence n=1 Tax=Sphaerobolus stellatus (strain SS14) TaxID=990650 RepID=A0A0C9VFL7_SPHS4|nr:hypothetical protein M422DRAFT_256773 [Sphaerobolus stellatus SS14]